MIYNPINPYRAYIKDCLKLNERPKVIIPIKDADYSEDKLTNATSSFNAYDDLPKEIQNGDIFCLFKPNGKVVYQGVITQIEDKTITCDQITSIFRGSWFYVIDEEDYLEHEIYDVLKRFMKGQIADLVTTLPEANYDNWKLRKLYLKKNGSKYEQYYINRLGNGSDKEPYKYSMDRLGIKPEDESQGDFVPYDLTEAQYKNIVDDLVKRKFDQFTMTYEGSQELHLTASDDDHEILDMEEFIYDLYKSYGVVIDIQIPYNGGCTIKIKTPNYDSTKIAMNSKSILSIDPRKETAEYNKLVVMYTNGAYRASYYTTPTGIVDIDTDETRLPVVKTKIVYSDDELEDIKYENLKDLITNHEVNFEMYFDSKLYDWESWPLGMPLDVYYKDEIFNSYYTKYEAKLDFDSHTVSITCGVIRSKLTDKIKQKTTSTTTKSGSSAKVGGSGVSQTNQQADWNETNPSSGSYIKNKPTTPAGQKQSDWAVTDTSDAAYIKNKPTIPTQTAVKGDAESNYRTGNVNITKANIGLGNVDNTADANKEVKSAGTLTTGRYIDGVLFNGSKDIIHYGLCETVAATKAKVATLNDSQTFKLTTGSIVFIKMEYSNLATSPTLNVNGTGAKQIKMYGTTDVGTTVTTSWFAGAIVGFIYDGTNWLLIDFAFKEDIDVDNFVKKTGDYMSGILGMQDANINFLDTDLRRDVVPSGTKYSNALNIYGRNADDTANSLFTTLRAVQTTDGRDGMQLYTTRVVNRSIKYNTLTLYIDPSGNPIVVVTNKAAWRTGIDAAKTDHAHGKITTDGKINSDVTIANGDKLLIKDASDSNIIKTSSISFGTDETKFLSNKGTWVDQNGGKYAGPWKLLWTNANPYNNKMGPQTINLSGLSKYSSILLVIFSGHNPGGAITSDTPNYIIIPNITGDWSVDFGRKRTYTIEDNAIKMSHAVGGETDYNYNAFNILWKIYAC